MEPPNSLLIPSSYVMITHSRSVYLSSNINKVYEKWLIASYNKKRHHFEIYDGNTSSGQIITLLIIDRNSSIIFHIDVGNNEIRKCNSDSEFKYRPLRTNHEFTHRKYIFENIQHISQKSIDIAYDICKVIDHRFSLNEVNPFVISISNVNGNILSFLIPLFLTKTIVNLRVNTHSLEFDSRVSSVVIYNGNTLSSNYGFIFEMCYILSFLTKIRKCSCHFVYGPNDLPFLEYKSTTLLSDADIEDYILWIDSELHAPFIDTYYTINSVSKLTNDGTYREMFASRITVKVGFPARFYIFQFSIDKNIEGKGRGRKVGYYKYNDREYVEVSRYKTRMSDLEKLKLEYIEQIEYESTIVVLGRCDIPNKTTYLTKTLFDVRNEGLEKYSEEVIDDPNTFTHIITI